MLTLRPFLAIREGLLPDMPPVPDRPETNATPMTVNRRRTQGYRPKSVRQAVTPAVKQVGTVPKAVVPVV